MTWKDSDGIVYRTYKDLFSYLDRKCKFRTDKNDKLSWVCHNDLRFTKAFCKRHKLDFERVKHVLNFFGGFCDCEVLFNADSEQFEDIWEHRGTMILEDKRNA